MEAAKEIHPMTKLYMRIASLETEVRYLKDQLAKSGAGGAYLINLIAAHRAQNSHSPQQAAIEASEQQLQARVNDLLEENRLLKIEQKNGRLQAELDAVLKSNAALKRELQPFKDAINFGREQEKRDQIEQPNELGSWARGDAFSENGSGNGAVYVVPESVHRWVTDSAWPSSVEDCKRGTELAPKKPAAQTSGSNDAAASASDEAESCVSMEAGCSAFSVGEDNSEKATEKSVVENTEIAVNAAINPLDHIVTIEANTGETFFAFPAPSLTSSEEAAKHSLRRERRSIKTTIEAYEHNRLAGVATFIEDLDDEAYAKSWKKYEREHRDHSARQWREHYETEVRPAYLEKLAREKQAAEKECERHDSVLEPAVEPFPLIDMATIEEESAQIEEEVVVETAEKQPEPAAAPSFLRYNSQQLRDCRPFARSVVKESQRIAPDDPDFTTLLDMRNVREMPMVAYSGKDIKEIEIKSSSSSSRKGKLQTSRKYLQNRANTWALGENVVNETK
jgi:hypothetical protein